MAGEAAIPIRPWASGAATENKPRVVEGQKVSPRRGEPEPSQWAIDAGHLGNKWGVYPAIALFVIYLASNAVGWLGPNVLVPWQTRFLGAEQAQANLVTATAGLVTLINGMSEKERARDAQAAAISDALVKLNKRLDEGK